MRLGRKLAVGVAEDGARPATQRKEDAAPVARTPERIAVDQARERREVPAGPAPAR